MNTADNKIQWHPAFDASLQVEFEEEADELEFFSEHQLSKNPMRIDVLIIKKKRDVALKKNIGRIFRKYNIVEYKAPGDYVSIDDFYKTYGYACIYKAETGNTNYVLAEELTITIAGYHYPRKMISFLKKERGIVCEKAGEGIYYLTGDAIPIQLIVIPQLSEKDNYWMHLLRDDIKAGSEVRKFMERYEPHKTSNLYQAMAEVIVRANRQEMEEEKEMCEALRELFAEELQESWDEGAMCCKIGQTMKKYKKGCSIAQTADMLEESLDLIKQIYDAIRKIGVDSEVSDIYQMVKIQ